MNFSKPVFIMLVAVLLSCSGCSKVTFTYNHGDKLLYYWFNDYTSFNSQQQDVIRLEVADYMRWHRQYALPEYIAFLQGLDTLVRQQDALSSTDVMHTTAELRSLYRLTMTPFIRPAAHVLSTLDSTQIAQLRMTLAKKNRDEREEMLSGNAQENLDKRADKYIRFTEELIDHLSSDQKNKIREMSLSIPFITTSYIEHREAMQDDLISLLNDHAGEDKVATLFSQWINTPPVSTSPQTMEAYDSAMNEMIARIYALLTADQRDHLRKKIAAYISDFQKLHSAT